MIHSSYGLAPKSAFNTKEKPVIVALNAAEEKALTPAYPSVRDFWAKYDAWQKSHPHAKLVWLARHGESYSNVFDLTQHPTSYSPLTPRGQLHAKALADFLQGTVFDQIISSDAERTYTTVEEAAKRNPAAGRIRIDSRIQEFSFWPAGNMPLKETQRVFADLVSFLYMHPELYAAPGQISLADFKARLGQVLTELAKAEHSNILLGTHGMTIVLTVMEALNIPLEKYWAAVPFLPFSRHAGITVLSYDADIQKWELLVYADNSYLPEELKGKKPATPDLEIEYYREASMRLELLKEGQGRFDLSD
jgi:broad specificity phosphatase PhoE